MMNQDFFREQILLSSDQVDFSLTVNQLERRNSESRKDEEDNG